MDRVRHRQDVLYHKIELRTFNGATNFSSASVKLTPGREENATWKLKVLEAAKPWAVVAVPDGNLSGRQELSGAARELAQIE